MLNQKKPLIISAVILGGALIVSLAVIFGPKLKNFSPQGKKIMIGDTTSTENIDAGDSQNYPIALNEPGVGQAFIHYFIEGKITAIEGQQDTIVLDNPKLPKFQLGAETRIAKMSPPYGSQNSTIIKQGELKAGLNIIISAEFELRSQQWLVRDVFVPTDKN